MPNWCSTNINIKCNDKVKLKEFYSKLEKWTSQNYCDNGFGLNWLGNVVGNSGIGTINTKTKTDLRCRGSIDYMDLTDDQIVLSTETAWGPMLKMWVKLLDKYLPEAEIIYASEECGCGLYATNDRMQEGVWFVDDFENDIYECMQTEELIPYLQNLLNSNESNVDDLLQFAIENDYEVYAHQYEYVDINEWD